MPLKPKVVLEEFDSTASKCVVYATSNRRHLIREFCDRPAPAPMKKSAWIPCRRNFRLAIGLTLTLNQLTRTYLKIVNQLAKIAGISSQEDLEYRALQWATRHNGRSGRTARQFIDFLKQN